MAVLSTSEAAGSRFSVYIGELQEVFGQHRVPSGSPSNLDIISARLSTPGLLAEDVSSILRAAVLRQGGSLPPSDLLEILAAAAGGPKVLERIGPSDPGYPGLVSFIAGVTRRPWNVPPGGDLPAPAPEPFSSAAAKPRETQWGVQATIARAQASSLRDPEAAPVHDPAQQPPAGTIGILAGPATPPEPVLVAASSGSEPGTAALIPEIATSVPSSAATSSASVPDQPHAAAPQPTAAHEEQLRVLDRIAAPEAFEADLLPASLNPAAERDLADFCPDLYSDLPTYLPAETTELGEPPLAVIPPPPTSSAPLWLGAGCALILILAISVWTRWIYAKPAHAPAPAGHNIPASAVVPATAQPRISQKAAADQAPPSNGQLPAPDSAVTAPHPAQSAAKPTAAVPAPAPKPAAIHREFYQEYEPPVRPARPVSARRARTVSAVTPPISAARTLQPSPVRVQPENEFAAAETPAASESAAVVVPPLEPWTKPIATSSSPYIQVSAGVMASHLLLSPDPSYPTLAKLTHIQGQVTVEAVISNRGVVVDAHVLSGHHLLRGAALSAVKGRRYRPYVLDGRPVEVSTVVTVDFNQHR